MAIQQAINQGIMAVGALKAFSDKNKLPENAPNTAPQLSQSAINQPQTSTNEILDILRNEQKAQMANIRAEILKQQKKSQKEKVEKTKYSFLNEPISIGGQQIGTVRELPKDLKKQAKEQRYGRKE